MCILSCCKYIHWPFWNNETTIIMNEFQKNHLITIVLFHGSYLGYLCITLHLPEQVQPNIKVNLVKQAIWCRSNHMNWFVQHLTICFMGCSVIVTCPLIFDSAITTLKFLIALWKLALLLKISMHLICGGDLRNLLSKC